MSYCRWSSECENGAESDVYTYAHVNGTWTTHVAARKLIKPRPDKKYADYENKEEYWKEHDECLAQIGLSEDDKTFVDGNPKSCAETLIRLRDIGYNVPQYAIDRLKSEAEDDT